MAAAVLDTSQCPPRYLFWDDCDTDWIAAAQPQMVLAAAAGVDGRHWRAAALAPAHDGVVADAGSVAGAAALDHGAGAAAALLGAARERAELPQDRRRRPARRRAGAVVGAGAVARHRADVAAGAGRLAGDAV